jgi:carboxymethylenebutenolidase
MLAPMDLRTSTLDIETRDGVADAYLAAPEGLGPYPGVLLYMDAFGPRPRLEEMAQHIASAGYVVLLPNVFYRQGRAPLVDTSDLMDPEARGRLFKTLNPWLQQLTPERAMSDAEAYVDVLGGHDEVADGPLGVVGYCMGGALALRTAGHLPERFAATAAFHPARLRTCSRTG